jgi:hypothetical protein
MAGEGFALRFLSAAAGGSSASASRWFQHFGADSGPSVTAEEYRCKLIREWLEE